MPHDADPTDDLISITEATRLTGRHRDTIQSWIKSGRLPVAVDIPRRRRLHRVDVLKAARIELPAQSGPAA